MAWHLCRTVRAAALEEFPQAFAWDCRERWNRGDAPIVCPGEAELGVGETAGTLRSHPFRRRGRRRQQRDGNGKRGAARGVPFWRSRVDRPEPVRFRRRVPPCLARG